MKVQEVKEKQQVLVTTVVKQVIGLRTVYRKQFQRMQLFVRHIEDSRIVTVTVVVFRGQRYHQPMVNHIPSPCTIKTFIGVTNVSAGRFRMALRNIETTTVPVVTETKAKLKPTLV